MDSSSAIVAARTELARRMSQRTGAQDDAAITQAARRWFDAIAADLEGRPGAVAVLPVHEAFALHDAIDEMDRLHNRPAA